MFTFKIGLDADTAKRFDRLMDYLEGKLDAEWQAKFDQLTGAVTELDKSRDQLKTAVTQNQ